MSKQCVHKALSQERRNCGAEHRMKRCVEEVRESWETVEQLAETLGAGNEPINIRQHNLQMQGLGGPYSVVDDDLCPLCGREQGIQTER